MGNIRCPKCGFFYPEITDASFSCHPQPIQQPQPTSQPMMQPLMYGQVD